MCRPVVVIRYMNWTERSVEESSVAKMCGYCRNICKKLEMADPGIIMVIVNAARIVAMRQPKTLCSVRNVVRDYDVDGDNYALILRKYRECNISDKRRFPSLQVVSNKNAEGILEISLLQSHWL